ncbi:two-component system, NtrC family, sensor kinase [Candidatus Magnetomoraceae bacterium gMMP-13]
MTVNIFSISNWSIITKLILMVCLIIIFVGGIVAVNVFSFHHVENSMVSMIDGDIAQIIKNTQLKREFREIFIKADLLIKSFTVREKTLKTDTDYLLEKLKRNTSDLKQEQGNLKVTLQEYTRNLQFLFEQCILLNVILDNIRIIECKVSNELKNIDGIVLEKELTMIMEGTEEVHAIKQLGIMLPGFREILFEIIVLFDRAKQAYLGTKLVQNNHEQKLLGLLEEFDIGFKATTISWKKINLFIEELMKTTSDYRDQVIIFFINIKKFQAQVDNLNKAEKKVMIVIAKMNEHIAGKTKTIRRNIIDNIETCLKLTGLLSSIVIAVLIIIGIYIVKMIQPIKDLNIGTKRIGSGELDYKVKIKSKDEIGQLAISFNNMTEELQETTVSKEYVENIIKSMIGTLIVATPEGIIQIVNKAACDMLGYQKDELMGQPIEKILGEEKTQKIFQRTEINNLLYKGIIREVETIYLTKDGSKVPVLFSSSVMCYRKNKIQEIICIAQDITKFKQSESRFKAVFETAQDSIFIKDSLLRYTQINSAMEELFELPASKIIGRTDADLFGEEAAAHIRKVDTRVLNGEIIEEEHSKPVNGVIHTFHVIKVPLHESDNIIGLCGIARDVTERVKAEAEIKKAKIAAELSNKVKSEYLAKEVKRGADLKKANEKLVLVNKELKETQQQLIQTSKLASIGELATGVAHELNQPLSYIRNGAQLIMMDSPEDYDPQEVYETLKKVEQGTDRMMLIINNLRRFSRQTIIEFIPFDIHKVIDNTLIFYNEQFKVHNILIEKKFASWLPKVAGNSNQIEQVFINLISNARDALDEKEEARLIIKTDFQPKKNDPGIVSIKFIDNGMGISLSHQEKIFDPFFTTKEEGKGTGLGLSISYGIIKEHKGNINVSSVKGKGTTFTITLPALTNKESNKET